jgi:TetR/AcrR family transcriptional repressor of nem operon
MHFDETNPGGCLVVLSVLESEQHDARARADLEKTMHDMKRLLQLRLNRAKKAGELAPDLDAGSMASTIAATMAGMMVLGKANFSKAALKKTVNQVVSLLD